MSERISCLIDTNILIQFEEEDKGTGVLKSEFAEVFKLCQKHNVTLFIHPSSEEDIKRDKDEKRQKRTLSFKGKYPELEKPPVTTIDKLEEMFGGIKDENDKVDCLILYALYQDCVDFVLTEDSGIHRRSQNDKVHLKDRVFSISEFKEWLKRNFEPQTVELPDVEDTPVYSIDTNAPFFNSLRETYNDQSAFDAWLAKCKKEKRRAWVVKDESGDIAGICIYNLDNEYSDKITELGGKALKLCTFKISEHHRGMKLGELLLKTVYMYAVENDITSVWLTAFGADQVHLIHFLKDFGFRVADFLHNDKEDILFKVFNPPEDLPEMSPLDFHKLYSPHFYDTEEISKYIIPIVPEYHELLFPELVENKVQQLTLLPELKDDKIPGNTIKKVYLCHSPTKSLPPGSLVVFYRSQDEKSVTTVGIVEETFLVKDFSTMIRLIGKRSVYSLEEIRGMLAKETMVIEFRFVKHLRTKMNYQEMIDADILKGPPISITKLTDEGYTALKNNSL